MAYGDSNGHVIGIEDVIDSVAIRNPFLFGEHYMYIETARDTNSVTIYLLLKSYTKYNGTTSYRKLHMEYQIIIACPMTTGDPNRSRSGSTYICICL